MVMSWCWVTCCFYRLLMISAYMCTLNQLALYPYPPTPRGWSEVCLAHPPQIHLPNAETFRRLHTSQRCSAYACLHSPVWLVYQSPPAAALLFRFALCDARYSSLTRSPYWLQAGSYVVERYFKAVLFKQLFIS